MRLLVLFYGSPADLLVVDVMASAGNFCFHAAAASYLCAIFISCKILVVAVHFSLVVLWHVHYDAFAVLSHMRLLLLHLVVWLLSVDAES